MEIYGNSSISGDCIFTPGKRYFFEIKRLCKSEKDHLYIGIAEADLNIVSLYPVNNKKAWMFAVHNGKAYHTDSSY